MVDETYKGVSCHFCGSPERYVKNDKCVSCTTYSYRVMNCPSLIQGEDGRKNKKKKPVKNDKK